MLELLLADDKEEELIADGFIEVEDHGEESIYTITSIGIERAEFLQKKEEAKAARADATDVPSLDEEASPATPEEEAIKKKADAEPAKKKASPKKAAIPRVPAKPAKKPSGPSRSAQKDKAAAAKKKAEAKKKE